MQAKLRLPFLCSHPFFLVSADMRDDFRILPKDTDVSVGEDTILKCAPPKGYPQPVVRWKKDGEYLDLTSSNRYCITCTAVVVI